MNFSEQYPYWIRAGLIILITLLVFRFITKVWHRKFKDGHSLIQKFIFNILQALIILFGCLFAIDQIPQLSSIAETMLAGSGIMALGISLSAQESLNNIVSGLFISLFKPFEVGDRIAIVEKQITGIVEGITLRHTIIRTFVNTRYVVPNSVMNDAVLENSDLIDERASSFVDILVAYESDIDRAMEIMSQIIGDHPLYLDVRTEEQKQTQPKVKVYVRALEGSGIALRANMWTKTVAENFDACSDVRLAIKKAFDREGIEIPYQKYTIIQQDDQKKTGQQIFL